MLKSDVLPFLPANSLKPLAEGVEEGRPRRGGSCQEAHAIHLPGLLPLGTERPSEDAPTDYGDERSPVHLLKDLVGSDEYGLRDREPERLRGLQVDDEFKLGGLLDREVGGLGALEDLVDVERRSSCQLGPACSVREESTGLGKLFVEEIDSRW